MRTALSVSWSVVTALVAALVAAASLANCAGCSEECSGENQGAETCPCSSDQDCTTRLGTVLLCVDGGCAVGDPPDAPNGLGDCDAEGECGAGLACGIDDTCSSAPACQRIDAATLSAMLETGETVPVTAERSDCTHAWSADGTEAGEAFDSEITFDLDGNGTATNGCEAHWFAPHRVGQVTCDGTTWAIVPTDEENPVVACVGAACDGPVACRQLGDAASVGVCP